MNYGKILYEKYKELFEIVVDEDWEDLEWWQVEKFNEMAKAVIEAVKNNG